MKTLLWKEYRENGYKVLLAVAACFALHMMRLRAGFNHWFSDQLDMIAASFGLICAVAMAMDAVAGERVRGTLPFLMARPRSALRLLVPKFAAGAIGLFVTVAAFWIMAYATPLDTGENHFDTYDLFLIYTLADIGWPTMTWLFFLPALVAYGIAFVGSAASEDPVQSLAASAMLGALAFVLVVASHFTWVEQLLEFAFTWQGTLVRTAGDAGQVASRSAVAAAMVAITLAAAAAITQRFRGAALGWRPLIVCGAVMTLGPMTVGALTKKEIIKPNLPVGTLPFEEDAQDMAIAGRTAYVLIENGMVTVDLTRPDSLVQTHFLPLPGWKMKHLAIGDGAAIAFGLFADTRGERPRLAVFDLNGNEARPDETRKSERLSGGRQTAGALQLAGTQELPQLGPDDVVEDVAVAGGTALVWSANEKGSSLLAFHINADGSLSTGDEVRFENEIHRYPHGGVIFTGIGKPHIASAGDYAFVGMRSGLAVVDVSDASNLTRASMTELEAADRRMGWVRKVSVSGDTLFVARHWPGELVMMDVSEPLRPVEIASVRDPIPMGYRSGSRLFGRYLFSFTYNEIDIYDALQPDKKRGIEELNLNSRPWSRVMEMTVSHEYLWVLGHDELLAMKPQNVPGPQPEHLDKREYATGKP